MFYSGCRRSCSGCQLTNAGGSVTCRGVKNEFVIDDEELGELLEVTIGHDNSGYSASWHMDHLTITNMKTGQVFVFPCRLWFDSRVGDGQIERILPVAPDAGKLVPYIFNITTTDMRGAGTDAGARVAAA
jgi:lipoxygenase homology domain-containing protein 1